MLILPSKHNAMKLNFKSLEYHVILQLFDLVITSVQRTLNLSLFNFANVVPIITYTLLDFMWLSTQPKRNTKVCQYIYFLTHNLKCVS